MERSPERSGVHRSDEACDMSFVCGPDTGGRSERVSRPAARHATRTHATPRDACGVFKPCSCYNGSLSRRPSHIVPHALIINDHAMQSGAILDSRSDSPYISHRAGEMRTSQCLPPGETTAVALTLRSPAGDCWWQTVGTMAPLFSSRLRSLRSASLRGPASGSAARLSILWTLPVRTFFAICFLARSWFGCGFGGDFLRADGGGAVAAARARRAWPRVVGAIRARLTSVPRTHNWYTPSSYLLPCFAKHC